MMDREQYKEEMKQVSEASLGLEMANHVQTCPACFALLTEANKKVIQHIQEQS